MLGGGVVVVVIADEIILNQKNFCGLFVTLAIYPNRMPLETVFVENL